MEDRKTTPKKPPAAKPKPGKPAAKKAAKPRRRPARLKVEAATDRDIRAIAGADRDLAQGALAAAALALARRIDDPDTTASAAASCVARLRETLDELRQAAVRKTLERLRRDPPTEPKADEKKDPVDDLKDRRANRRARRPAS